MASARTYRKVIEKGGNARFYTPFHADFVTTLKNNVPAASRMWDADDKYWWIEKEYVENVDRIAQLYFKEWVNPTQKKKAPEPEPEPAQGRPFDSKKFWEGIGGQPHQAEEAFRRYTEENPNWFREEYSQEPPPRYGDKPPTYGMPGWKAHEDKLREEVRRSRERAQGKKAYEEATGQSGYDYNSDARRARDFAEEARKAREKAEEDRRKQQDPFGGAYRTYEQFGGDKYQPPKRPGAMSYSEAYATLQVTEKADDEVIRAAYKALTIKYHPDRPGGNEDRMKTINAARDMLRKVRKDL